MTDYECVDCFHIPLAQLELEDRLHCPHCQSLSRELIDALYIMRLLKGIDMPFPATEFDQRLADTMHDIILQQDGRTSGLMSHLLEKEYPDFATTQKVDCLYCILTAEHLAARLLLIKDWTAQYHIDLHDLVDKAPCIPTLVYYGELLPAMERSLYKGLLMFRKYQQQEETELSEEQLFDMRSYGFDRLVTD